ncbi:MAG: PLP-dependent aminotransferase family protein [Desulfurococcales archaeon]|nr:PLP-dependent aminotransferase family protein [Desulfurococcales archaeon]
MDYTKLFSSRTKYMKASEIRELLKLAEGKDVISFAGGLPDPQTFPVDEMAEISSYVIEKYGAQALQYAPTAGVTLFRKTLASWLENQGVAVNSDDMILVTTGSQQGLDLTSRVLLDKGDIVITEKPTYLAAINAFKPAEPRFIGIEIDDDGMKTDELEKTLKTMDKQDLSRIKFVYTIPTSQNPGGVTMSMERRKHLLELAEQYDLLIVEDDPYSHFVFEPIEFKPLKTLDKNGRVLYLGTFSKILAPGLRVGFMLGNKDLVSMMELAKQAMDLHSSSLSQYVALEAIKRGVVDKTIEKAKNIYKVKRDAMLEALDKYFTGLGRWTRPVGGMFVFVYLNKDVDTKSLMYKALDKGVAYVPGGSFFVDGTGKNTLRLNFSYPSIEQIREGIKRLGELFSSI